MRRTYFFTADWCESCPPVKLRWFKAVRDYPDLERHVVDMTTDEGRRMAGQYGIRGLPAILLLNDDGTAHELWTNPGIMSETDFDTKLFHWQYPVRGFLDNQPYHFFITETIAGDKCVFNMFFKIIRFAEYCRYSTLGIPGIGII